MGGCSVSRLIVQRCRGLWDVLRTVFRQRPVLLLALSNNRKFQYLFHSLLRQLRLFNLEFRWILMPCRLSRWLRLLLSGWTVLQRMLRGVRSGTALIACVVTLTMLAVIVVFVDDCETDLLGALALRIAGRP